MNLEQYTFEVVNGLSVLTVIGQIIAVVLLAFLVRAMLNASRKGAFQKFIDSRGLVFLFIVALIATLGSLFFSEIAGWTPCRYCWFQRIFMYPQVILVGLALWKRDKHIALYVLALCLIGIYFSTAHYIEQVEAALRPAVDDALVPCDASGVSCAKTEINFTFGYITIPMMALTAFVMNALMSLHIMRSKQ